MAFGDRLMQRCAALARFSSLPDGLTRLYLTSEHRAAATLVEAWMRDAGMATNMDAAGTVTGHYPATRPEAPVLLLGSHIDSVRNAGNYDGNLGVLVAIEAVGALYRQGKRCKFAIEVLAFGDEEGVRFPVTLTGSRALAGIFDPAALVAADSDGISLRTALETFGLQPAGIARLARKRQETLGYVEVHIEQGPVLEAEGLALGIVTAISGASRLRLTVTGTAGHAGTVPMRLRQDALAAAAEMILLVEKCAQQMPGLVATVGHIRVFPGAVNVIAGRAEFSLDIRSAEDADRHAALAWLTAALEDIARRRGVTLSISKFYDEAAAVCDPALRAGLAQSAARLGIATRDLPSGAGHDGLAMIALCPIAMLFVRCKGGISHNPAESILAADADAAVALLLDFLTHYEPN